jgi:hypothetical protein
LELIGPQIAKQAVYNVNIYDFDRDSLSQTITFKPETFIGSGLPNSWSPNEILWAFVLSYSDEDLTSFRRIELLQLETGEIQRTCFGLYYTIKGAGDSKYVNYDYPTDFAWSRDSRYMALTGVLEGEDMNETYGVYIYDTQTSEIYEVYRGRADIVGWMANPKN